MTDLSLKAKDATKRWKFLYWAWAYGSRRIALIGFGVVAIVASVVLIYVRGAPQPGVFLSTPPDRLHYAGDETLSVRTIRIKAVYFVPRGLASSPDPSWRALLEAALDGLKRFYEFQLHQVVTISYDIYPVPVIGEEQHQFYDGEDTSRGNPNALLAVREELLRRLFEESSRLFPEDFVMASSKDVYEVMAILYEGVGSSATIFRKDAELPASADVVLLDEGPPAFLISTFFLNTPQYQDFGLSIFAHEFAHTLGLPDSYDSLTGQALSDDIMGLGRFRPLTFTYLSGEAKKNLGLSY